MANRTVSIWKHIKLDGKWRFASVYRNPKNHKLEANKVVVAGKVKHARASGVSPAPSLSANLERRRLVIAGLNAPLGPVWTSNWSFAKFQISDQPKQHALSGLR